MKSHKAMLLLFVLPQLAAAQTIDSMALRAQTRFLSADALQGRGAGTRGEQIAAEYIASELTRLGVNPLSNGSYFQRVPLKRAIVTNATVDFAGNRYGTNDFVWNTGGVGGLRSFRGGVLFVGAIDSVALRRVSETRGRVVVINGPMGVAAQTYVPALIAAGAAGVVLAVPDSTMFGLFARSRGESRYMVDANVEDPIWQPNLPVIIAGPKLTRALVARERFTLVPGEFSAELVASTEPVHAVNVVGIVPGKSPTIANEVVAYTAHYDHLGVSSPDARGDSIYNGFSDNAAGVAMLLGIARLMQNNPPQRSVMFIFFTAEERGLLGSTYYASNPLLPLERMAAVINLDAGAPPAPPVSWRIAGGTASTLGDIARAVAQTRRWTADVSAASANSDYWPFLERRVPSIFIVPGNVWENVTAERQATLRAKWDRYHRADDEWSSDFPFSGLVRYAEFAYLIGRTVADQPARPRMQAR